MRGIIINRPDKFLYINPATETLTGFTHDEFLAMDFSSFVHPDYLNLVREWALARLQGPPEAWR